jgi:hypothetical protein
LKISILIRLENKRVMSDYLSILFWDFFLCAV